MSIVRAKMLPPRLVSGVVDRPRLITRIDGIWSRPIGLIVAPAGFGKSTLARAWMATQHGKVGWLTLDAADNDLDRFILYMLEAIAAVDPGSVANTRSLIERSSRPAPRDLAETLADELMDVEDDLCIVLDEAEHLSAPEAWEFIACLIRLTPPRFHLLVLSRIDPPLPLARLRMREQLVEFRGNDLLLNADEIRTLFDQQGVPLSDEHVDDLQRATYGWPAGIRLALVQGAHPEQHWQFNAEPSAPNTEFVLDPLAAEVVERLPAHISETLLAASILDDLNPELLEALIGQELRARELIEEYARAGVLISSAPRGGGWMRFHPLFRDLFRRQLSSRRSRAEINQLHHNAAEWFIANGEVRSAIAHLLAARALDALSDLLTTAIPSAIDQEHWSAVAEWLNDIPEEIIARSPVLALGNCWVQFFKGNWLAMHAARNRLRPLLVAMPPDQPQTRAWLAELAILDAMDIGSFLNDADEFLTTIAVAAPDIAPDRRFVRGHVTLICAMALEEIGRPDEADRVIKDAIGQGSARVDSEVIRALVARCFVLRQRGDFPRLEAASSELELIARTHNLPVSQGWAHLFHGFVLFQRNDLVGAEADLADLASHHAQVHIACLREGMLLLARVYHAQGDPAEAAAVLRRLREILAQQGSVEMLPPIASLEEYLIYLESPLERAAGRGLSELPSVVDTTPHVMHHPVTTAVLLNAESGRAGAEQALQLAETFAAHARAMHYPCWEPEILALQAIALSALERHDEAVDRMRAALNHGLARYLTRTFLDLGYRSHALYQDLMDDAEVGHVARSLLSGVRLPTSPAVTDPAPVASEPRVAPANRRTLLSLLTDRELTVLELLEKRLSYKEIGDTLAISPLTVKRHAGNIYDKLGATSRREAVAIAREYGWNPERDPR
jgi:LuxR family maltose regulon positive regulatory protein